MSDRDSLHVATFRTELGWFGAVIAQTGLRQLVFGHQCEADVFEKLDLPQIGDSVTKPEWWPDAQNLLIAYAQGEEVDLNEIPLELHKMTSFQQQVVDSLRKVVYGEVVSYAELAQRAGSPGAARAVGNQMARNRLPLVIPCHRVIGSGGRLGGFSAPQGLDMKRRLLALERVGRADADVAEWAAASA